MISRVLSMFSVFVCTSVQCGVSNTCPNLYACMHILNIIRMYVAYAYTREANGSEKSRGLVRYSNTFGVLRPLLAPLN